MHKLDVVEKLTKIIFGSVAAVLFSYAGLTVQWDRIGIQEDSFCVRFAETAEAAMLRQSETIPQLVVDRFAERCGVDMREATLFVAETAAIVQAVPAAQQGLMPAPVWLEPEDTAFIAVDPNGGSDVSIVIEPDGYIAIGQVGGSAYSDVNFDRFSNGEPAIMPDAAPQEGDILVARWPVHVRANTQLTTSGRNPSRGLIAAGDCIEVLAPPDVERGQYWAAIQTVSCD